MDNGENSYDPHALAEWHASRAEAKRDLAAAWRRRGENVLGAYYERGAELHAATARLLRSISGGAAAGG